MAALARAGRPLVRVVGLGPAGPELTTPAASAALSAAPAVLLRTERHPAAAPWLAAGGRALDGHYERAERFEDAYAGIVEEVVATAGAHGAVAYAVPGSPLVLERTVELLLADERVEVDLVAGMSFLDLAWARLRVDPVVARARLVDAERFATDAAGDTGPLLVCQVWSPALLSAVKLAVEPFPATPVVALRHLGLVDEEVRELAWEDLDRGGLEADHLTCLWVPRLEAPVAAELVRLEELVRVLRERCPWDREQTHASLARHLLEEAYEAIEAIQGLGDLRAGAPGAPATGAPATGVPATGVPVAGGPVAEAPPAEAVDHLEEELGDVLCQVLYHARLAEEEGLFDLADVARATHDKLVARHPHVFGEAQAADAAEVLRRWERDKQREKGRASLTEGIPAALPALALTAKLERKLHSAGLGYETTGAPASALEGRLDALLGGLVAGDRRTGASAAGPLGELLVDLARLAASAGLDAEDALARAAGALAGRIRAAEAEAEAAGTPLLEADEAGRRRAWRLAGGDGGRDR